MDAHLSQRKAIIMKRSLIKVAVVAILALGGVGLAHDALACGRFAGHDALACGRFAGGHFGHGGRFTGNFHDHGRRIIYTWYFQPGRTGCRCTELGCCDGGGN
jgi:hypothetical protein